MMRSRLFFIEVIVLTITSTVAAAGSKRIRARRTGMPRAGYVLHSLSSPAYKFVRKKIEYDRPVNRQDWAGYNVISNAFSSLYQRYNWHLRVEQSPADRGARPLIRAADALIANKELGPRGARAYAARLVEKSREIVDGLPALLKEWKDARVPSSFCRIKAEKELSTLPAALRFQRIVEMRVRQLEKKKH